MSRWSGSAVLLLCFIMLLTGAGIALGEPVSSEKGTVYAVADALTNSLLKCPNRIWPGVDWSKSQFIIVDSHKKQAVLWNRQLDKKNALCVIKPIPYSELPPELAPMRRDFEHVEWEKKDTLAVLVTDFDADNISLIIHEGFHQVADNHFKHEEAFFRGYLYPEDWKPRYYRHQILRSLGRALFENDSKALGAAAYWQQQWKKLYPRDAQKLKMIDIVEGTAEYASYMGAFLTVSGCSVSETELTSKSKQVLKEVWTVLSEDYSATSKDFESYAVGAMAGLLLRQKNVPEWNERVMKGETPMDVLASSIKPIAQKDDPESQKYVRETYASKNKDIEQEIGPFLKHIHSHEYYILSIPLTWNMSTFSPGSFVTATDGGIERDLTTRMEVSFESPNKSTKIEIKGTPTEFVKEPMSLMLPVPKKALKKNGDGKYSIDIPEIKADNMAAKLVKKSNGQEWIMLE